MEELTNQDKKDILRKKLLNRKEENPPTFENVPQCNCGSLNLTWNTNGTYTCKSCNKTISKANMGKINYNEYKEDNLQKEILDIMDREEFGDVFVIG